MAQAGKARHGGAGPHDHYQAVTDRIVAALEGDTLPWRRPWVQGAGRGVPGLPCNAISGRSYRGINAVLLAMTGFAHGSDDPRWRPTSRRPSAAGRCAPASAALRWCSSSGRCQVDG